MKTLIIGYGYIGKLLFNELTFVNPDIYDEYLKINTKRHASYDIAWLCLPTPYDTCEIHEIIKAINKHEASIYVIKSTILPSRINELLDATKKQIVICPEFYGRSKDSTDFKQDYTILGGNITTCNNVINAIKYCYNGNHRFITTSHILASLVKYMSNSFFLTKQTFCNEFYKIAAFYDESYNELRELFILDKRLTGIRTHADEATLYLKHHCLSKDVPAIAKETNNQFLNYICSFHHAFESKDE